VVFAIRLFGGNDEPVQAEPEVIEEVAEEVVEVVDTPKVHVLQPGEFLAKISKEYYGTEDSVAAIIRLNNLTNPDNVPVGTELLLP
jgi:LysM repeat protein